MTNASWTLWVFAGPGALSGPTFTTEPVLLDTPAGELLPLADVLARLLGDQGKLPAGVKVVAETVGEPTVLQQLTGEWPTQRLVGEPGQGLAVDPSRSERDLGRFLAWAETQTPKGSKRALIVLGDVLQAIGEVPKRLPAGGYRPTYPASIRVKPSTGSWTTYSTTDTTPSSSSQYGVVSTDGAGNKIVTSGNTLGNWISGLSSGDAIDIGDGSLYLLTRLDIGDGINQLIFVIAESDPPSAKNFTNKIDTTKTYKQYVSVVPLATTIAVYPYATRPQTSEAERSVDDVGPAPVDLTTRRVDALARALAGRRIDLLASDECELVRVVALRRLASDTSAMVGPQGSRACAGQPLVAMLEALAAEPDAAPETLAAGVVEAYATRTSKLVDAASRSPSTNDPVSSATRERMAAGHSIGALRRSGATSAVDALDALAGEVLASGASSVLMTDVAGALREGGDIAHLIDRLGSRGAALEAGVAATIVARRVIAAASLAKRSLGIDLDGLGLQLGAVSNWTRLLDQITGNPSLDVQRRTLEDMESLTRRMRCGSANASEPSTPMAWLEYDPKPSVDFEPNQDFEAFLAGALASPARHLALVVRGMRAAGHTASIALAAGGSLTIATLARRLREHLNERGRGPLAMIVFDDPELLGLEIAHELADVAYTLSTSVAGSTPLTLAQLQSYTEASVVLACERDAVDDARQSPLATSIPALMDPWRREVARRLANHAIAQAPERVLQGIDLRHIESLCRRFDRVLEWMFDELGEPAVFRAVELAANESSMIGLIYQAQMGEGGLYASGNEVALAGKLDRAFGYVYNWITVSKWSEKRGGAPFWLDPAFVEDRDPQGYCARLRIELRPHQPRDYRELSFHQHVRLHALLASARLLDGGSLRRWGLISLGLTSATREQRRAQLADDRDATDYFTYFGTPALLSLALEGDGAGQGYELRLSSSESAAALVRQKRVVDLAAVARTLAGLGDVFSSSAASREGWRYLESLGANLAEDVINDLWQPLELERARMLARGRSREAHLALQLPRELMRYPWEAMRLPGREGARRGELLAERFAIGRQMWSERAVRRVRRDARVRILIVADPRSNMPSLPGARAEALAIQSLFESMSEELGHGFTFECDATISETLTCSALRELVRDGNYDVLHYAGHASSAADAELAGWLLSDGLLSVTELRNTLAWTECPPWLIYANTCSAGMIDDRPSSLQESVHGMAEACIRAGVNAYVAPLWRIHDVSARMLATEFYRELLLARSTIGVSLHHARMRVRKAWEAMRGDTGLGDVSWAGMVLFGNPVERLNESAS